MSTDSTSRGGLEDVVAASSAICYLDGARGVLAYCGHDIHDLARHATFEEVCYLLWHRRLPTRPELGDLHSQLAAARQLPDGVLRLMRQLPPGDGMDALRTLTSALAHYDNEAASTTADAQYRKAAVRLTGAMARLFAACRPQQAGGGMSNGSGAWPCRQLPLHAHRERPGCALSVRASTSRVILHADHEPNASTFAVWSRPSRRCLTLSGDGVGDRRALAAASGAPMLT
jgi:citrate synthase